MPNNLSIKSRRRPQGGFTLIELLVVIGIIGILVAMLLPALVKAKDAAKRAGCMSNLRQIAMVYHMYSQDFDNKLPTADMLGNSSYRLAYDTLSLPYCFSGYIPVTSKAWLCPGGRDILLSNGVNYAWSRAQNLIGSGGDTAAFDTLTTTVVVWDDFTYALPSILNVPEGPSGGPTASLAVLRYYPHINHAQANYLYLDAHVETK